MRPLTHQRLAAYVAVVLLAILFVGDRELHAQSATNSRFDALVSLTEAKMKEYGVPGVAIGIIEEGSSTNLRGITVTNIRGLGVTNVEDSLPVSVHTVFPIASISKTFAATAMMRLVEQGKIDESHHQIGRAHV